MIEHSEHGGRVPSAQNLLYKGTKQERLLKEHVEPRDEEQAILMHHIEFRNKKNWKLVEEHAEHGKVHAVLSLASCFSFFMSVRYIAEILWCIGH